MSVKVALVTGAARGIGRAIAVTLAARGAEIVAFDLPSDVMQKDNASEAHVTAAAVAAMGRSCLPVSGDVRHQSDLDSAVSLALETWGRLDILIANAGIYRETAVWDIPEGEWDSVIDVNLTGAWRSIKAVAAPMRTAGSGSIVLLSSVRAHDGAAMSAHYAAAKAGLLGLMRASAAELAPFNVRVNAVLPGGTDTPMGRAATAAMDRDSYLRDSKHWFALKGRSALPPESVAEAVAWLASDSASDITGIELTVDGGRGVLPHWNLYPDVS